MKTSKSIECSLKGSHGFEGFCNDPILKEEVWILSSGLIAIWHHWAGFLSAFCNFSTHPAWLLQYKYYTNASQIQYARYTNTTRSCRKYNPKWRKCTKQIFRLTRQKRPASCFDEKGPDIGIHHLPHLSL